MCPQGRPFVSIDEIRKTFCENGSHFSVYFGYPFLKFTGGGHGIQARPIATQKVLPIRSTCLFVSATHQNTKWPSNRCGYPNRVDVWSAVCLLTVASFSFRALEFEMTHGQARKVIRQRSDFCINSLRYGLEFFETQPLDEMLVSTMKQIKRSGMIADTIKGY